jgi:hypothetical protein
MGGRGVFAVMAGEGGGPWHAHPNTGMAHRPLLGDREEGNKPRPGVGTKPLTTRQPGSL